MTTDDRLRPAGFPVALAAWLLDHGHSYYKISRAFVGGDLGGLTRESIIDNITLYWFTGTAASAARRTGRTPERWQQRLPGQPPPRSPCRSASRRSPARSGLPAPGSGGLDLASNRPTAADTSRMGRTSTLRVGTSRGVQVFCGNVRAYRL